MTPDDLKHRTKAFAIRVVRLIDALPRSGSAAIVGRQLLRCGTSVGANYRAACRARSRREFAAKMGIVEEECDEAIYWIEILIESGIVEERRLRDLLTEANEILSIVVASIKTSRRRSQSAIRNPQSAITEPPPPA